MVETVFFDYFLAFSTGMPHPRIDKGVIFVLFIVPLLAGECRFAWTRQTSLILGNLGSESAHDGRRVLASRSPMGQLPGLRHRGRGRLVCTIPDRQAGVVRYTYVRYRDV